MSQNICLFHVSNLSVLNFLIFLLVYPGSAGRPGQTDGGAGASLDASARRLEPFCNGRLKTSDASPGICFMEINESINWRHGDGAVIERLSRGGRRPAELGEPGERRAGRETRAASRENCDAQLRHTACWAGIT